MQLTISSIVFCCLGGFFSTFIRWFRLNGNIRMDCFREHYVQAYRYRNKFRRWHQHGVLSLDGAFKNRNRRVMNAWK